LVKEKYLSVMACGTTLAVSLDVQLRPARVDDVPFLWRMLTLAASLHGTAEDVALAQTDLDLKDYVEGFGRHGDVGIVALVAGRPAGAAWVRLAPAGSISETKVWSRDVPELAIATVPELRGAGVGTKLLRALCEAARGRHARIALTVREGSAAVHLYEREGFSIQRRLVNRVGTTSLVMMRAL
jgi:GNAT superfamily N-acetyltransferase